MKVPVHAVVGPPEMRRAWIAGLASDDAALAPVSCPCCTGRVELQVALTRLLRDRRPERVFIEIFDEAHLGMFGRAIAEWPLSQYVHNARPVRLPEDRLLAAEQLASRS